MAYNEISRKSWAYKLAQLSGTNVRYSDLNICEYRTGVIKGAIIVLAILIGVVVTSISYCHLGLLAVQYVQGTLAGGFEEAVRKDHWAFAAYLLSKILLLGAITIACLVALYAVFARVADYLQGRKRKERPTSGIKLAWQSFKGKYCHTVVFVDQS